MSSPDQDQLELELRQIGGVVFVSMAERGDVLAIELAVADGTDTAAVRSEAARIVRSQVEERVHLEVIERSPAQAAGDPAASRMRVQLLAVTPEPGGERVAVHLAHRGRRVAVACRVGDRVGAALAVLDGLRELGLPVPYEPAAVHLLPEDLGHGALVVLRHRHLGALRRGVSGGDRVEESVARAVLNGLNRFLAHEGRHAGAGMVDLRGG